MSQSPAPPTHVRAYGLTIASDFSLPECAPLPVASRRVVDVTIASGVVDGPMPAAPHDRLVRPEQSGFYLAWRQLGRIRVERGARVTVDLLPEFDVAALSLVLLGPVIALLLHQRGRTLFHGSAVGRRDGSAVLFLGDNGAGKSTLAAACLKAGLEILADDVIALAGPDNGPALLQPGFAAAKLSRAALAALDPLPGTLLPAIPPTAAKLRLRLPDFDEQPRPVARICIVRREGAEAPAPHGPAARLAALMRYSYMPKFGAENFAGPQATAHFRACAALAEQVPVTTLAVPASIADLPAFAARLDDLLAAG